MVNFTVCECHVNFKKKKKKDKRKSAVMSPESFHTCRAEVGLTQRGQVPAVLPHHVSVQCSLRRVQQCPLLLRELHGHILEGHQVLSRHKHRGLAKDHPHQVDRRMTGVETGNSKHKMYRQGSELCSPRLLGSACSAPLLSTDAHSQG